MHVNAILDEGTLLSNGALRSMAVERLPGYGRVVIADAGLVAGDVLILVNAYGINAALIDAALAARELGVTTIGLLVALARRRRPPPTIRRATRARPACTRSSTSTSTPRCRSVTRSSPWTASSERTRRGLDLRQRLHPQLARHHRRRPSWPGAASTRRCGARATRPGATRPTGASSPASRTGSGTCDHRRGRRLRGWDPETGQCRRGPLAGRHDRRRGRHGRADDRPARRRTRPRARSGRPAGQRVPRPRPQRRRGHPDDGRGHHGRARRGGRHHLGPDHRHRHRGPHPARARPGGAGPRGRPAGGRGGAVRPRRGPLHLRPRRAPAACTTRPSCARSTRRRSNAGRAGTGALGSSRSRRTLRTRRDQIRRLRALGVAVSLGHTHATTAQLRAAVDAGAGLATHLGNGIPPLLPRHPNAIWTLLADDRVTAGIIADGHHLPPEVLTVMLRAKTADRAFVVSDSTALAGRPPGRYTSAVGGRSTSARTGDCPTWAPSCWPGPAVTWPTVCATS